MTRASNARQRYKVLVLGSLLVLGKCTLDGEYWQHSENCKPRLFLLRTPKLLNSFRPLTLSWEIAPLWKRLPCSLLAPIGPVCKKWCKRIGPMWCRRRGSSLLGMTQRALDGNLRALVGIGFYNLWYQTGSATNNVGYICLLSSWGRRLAFCKFIAPSFWKIAEWSPVTGKTNP